MKIFITGCLLLGLAAGQDELSGSLSRCLSSSANDDLNSCLEQLAESLRPYMRAGIPYLNVPPTEPMFLDQIELVLKRPPIDVKVQFNDTVVSGLSSFILNSVRADLDTQKIRINMTVPELYAAGNYEMTGKAFVVIKDSKGPFQGNMTNANVVMETKLKVQSGRLLVDGEPKIEVKVQKLNVKLDNLFGGRTPQLANTITTFINKDSDKFIKDFGPQITQQIGQLAVKVYNTAVQDIDPSVFGLSK